MRAETGGSWEAVAARQHGLIHVDQCRTAGLSRTRMRSLISRGSLIRVHPAVYRVAAAPERWPQPLMAACLWSRGNAAAFGRAAAALWELDGYWRTHVALCGSLGLTPPRGVEYSRVRNLSPKDLTYCSSVRVTTVARTLLDLAAIVPPRTLERTLDETFRKQLVSESALRACIERNGSRGREGVGHLLALIEERRGQLAPDSVLETDVAAVLREEGIPTAVKRYTVTEKGRRIAEVDLAWPEYKVAVQVHGSSFHRQPRTWENDQRVENLLQLHGWLVVKMTHRMVKGHPAGCAELVRQGLRRSTRFAIAPLAMITETT